jgi:hypothetical protein
MATDRFRTAAGVLIAFNLICTVVTWTAHLAKPGTATAHAILNGTEFTAPFVLIVPWIACFAAMFVAGRVARVGRSLMTVFATVYSIGDVTELAKNNIGVSTANWHTIITLDAIGLTLGVLTATLGVLSIAQARRRPHAVA